jgi:endonuclease/exonuclease/phosphatase family metal-dependent hydrolase
VIRPAHALPLAAFFSLVSGACAERGLPPDQRASARCRAVTHIPAAARPAGAAAAADLAEAPSARPAPPMRWTVVGDSATRAVQDAFCAGVGPALIQEARTPPTQTPADRIVIVAWNMERGTGDLRRLIHDVRTGRHTGGAAVRELILLLQEVPRMGDEVPPLSALPEGVEASSTKSLKGPGIAEIAREEGLHLVYVPSMRAGLGRVPPTDHGTAVLSSLPLVEARAIELPLVVQRRVATVARVEWGSATPLYIVSAHLDNFSLRRPIASFGGMRARQARALARALPTTGVLVFGADLNTWALGRREAAFRILRPHLPRPAELQPEATARRLGVPRRLDYLLLDAPASWDFTERRLADRYASDHHPLIGVLKPLPQQNLQ